MIKAPAAERNKEPILQVLSTLFSKQQAGHVLEIASGTGQHVIHFASHFTNMMFTPSDYDADSLETIKHNVRISGLNNITEPVVIDVSQPTDLWPDTVKNKSYDLILCSNMIHISPWRCTEGLFAAAGKLLSPTGRLVTYGPYAMDGILTPQSNVQFDEYLKSQNPEWGVRDSRQVVEMAVRNGLKLIHVYDMPANNKILLFGRC